MEEKFYLTELFDVYGELLTKRQREVFNSHYLLDLSLSEIAEEQGISRQNVSDTIKKTKEKLIEYENTLLVIEKQKQILELIKNKDRDLAEKIERIISR